MGFISTSVSLRPFLVAKRQNVVNSVNVKWEGVQVGKWVYSPQIRQIGWALSIHIPTSQFENSDFAMRLEWILAFISLAILHVKQPYHASGRKIGRRALQKLTIWSTSTLTGLKKKENTLIRGPSATVHRALCWPVGTLLL